MPAATFDLKAFGDKELEAAMRRLPSEIQNKTMRGAIRKSANRLKDQILLAASGSVIEEDTGRLVNALEAQRIGTRREQDGTLVAFIKLPTRAQLGIPRYPKDTEYYPTILEYGSPTQPPRSYIRGTVNKQAKTEHAQIGKDLGKGADKAWRNLTKAR